MKRVSFLILWLIASVAAFAANPQETARACFKRATLKTNGGKHWLEECAVDIFTLRPFHPVFESLAPGTGTALGIGYDTDPHDGTIEWTGSVHAAVSPTDHSNSVDGAATIGFPGFSFGSRASRKSVADPERDPFIRALQAESGNPEIDAKAALSFRARRVEFREQDFFGLGQFTTQSGWSRYSMRDSSAGVTLGDPLTKWMAPSFSFDWIQPSIGSVLGQARPSTTGLYTEATAPGITTQPSFLRFEPDVWLRFKLGSTGITTNTVSLVPDITTIKAGYAFYHDTSHGTYSFRQAHLLGQTAAEVLIQTQHTGANRGWFSRVLCSPRPARECSLGKLVLTGDAVLSHTSGGSVVPFYFQPTLGGTDVQGEDSLRGFRDYRFRGPDRMFYQAEFRHDLSVIPIGVYGFYDVGRVGADVSDLTSGHLRHDLGVGAYFTAANIIVLRIFVGFGTREGIRPNFKLPGGGLF